MNVDLPILNNGQKLNDFIKVEPNVSFGSSGVHCLKCGAQLTTDEYFGMSWRDPKLGYVVVGWTTNKHTCKTSEIITATVDVH